MQTILGAGGSIGTDLAKELKNHTTDIRLVSRNPKKVNDTDQLFPADITDAAQLNRAIAGSDVCYITVGFEYTLKVWEKQWPAFIRNVVSACIEHKVKLVFFDNIYAIGGDNVKHITEESPYSSCSKKGDVRTFVDKHIMEAVSKGQLEAIIARAPDFFGPVKKGNSLLMNVVYDNMMKGKAAQWFCNADVKHSMGFTPDLAKGTAMLGNTADAYNQIWNLPVAKEAPTGREWVKLFAAEMNAAEKVQVLPTWALSLLGIFVPVLKEMREMCYQYDRDYVFDSSKFNKRFNYTPTSNKEAVKQTVAALKN
ncbi:MAG: NAD-dependent epimerase/dehydratase family protein [Bacteroidota bacterium]